MIGNDMNIKPGDLVRVRRLSTTNADGDGIATEEFGVFVPVHGAGQFGPIARVLVEGRILYILRHNLELVNEAVT
jgi:hypothetical protein